MFAARGARVLNARGFCLDGGTVWRFTGRSGSVVGSCDVTLHVKCSGICGLDTSPWLGVFVCLSIRMMIFLNPRSGLSLAAQSLILPGSEFS